MREYNDFKFRAWDGKEMHYNIIPWQWDFCISKSWHRCEKSTGTEILGSGGDTAEMLVPAIRFKNIMQFTGLTDKAGREIYEGDLVRLYGELIREVKFANAFWMLEEYLSSNVLGGFGTPSESGHKPMYRYPSNQIEIIGNIYSNPELIPNK